MTGENDRQVQVTIKMEKYDFISDQFYSDLIKGE